MLSRSRAARSKSSSRGGLVHVLFHVAGQPVRLAREEITEVIDDLPVLAALTLSMQGAEHLSMSPNRHGRPICLCRLKTPAEHVRAGNTRVSR